MWAEPKLEELRMCGLGQRADVTGYQYQACILAGRPAACTRFWDSDLRK